MERYNTAARHLNREALDWAKIAKYNFVEEFNILRYAREDVRPKKWSDGDAREAMKLHQRIKRAKEELERLNVEVRRLYTAIHDEHAHFKTTTRRLEADGRCEVMGAVEDRYRERMPINRSILLYIQEITEMIGYTGSRDLLGVRLGATGKSVPAEGLDKGVGKPTQLDDEGDGDAEEDDDEEDAQVGGVIDFLAEVASA